MSYSRFWDSDIYIYPSVLGDICCSGCLLGTKSVNIENDQDLEEHIKAHLLAGHNVPKGLLETILSDTDRYGAETPEML